MATPIYHLLDDLGSQEFMRVVLALVDEDFSNHTVHVVNGSNKPDDKAPTAKAALALADGVGNLANTIIKAKSDAARAEINEIHEEILAYMHLTFTMVTGPITQITNPKNNVIYLQHDNTTDITWVMYIYSGEWIAIGNFERDFAMYWSKDETDQMILNFQTIGIPPLSSEAIHQIIINAYNSLSPVDGHIRFRRPEEEKQ